MACDITLDSWTMYELCINDGITEYCTLTYAPVEFTAGIGTEFTFGETDVDTSNPNSGASGTLGYTFDGTTLIFTPALFGDWTVTFSSDCSTMIISTTDIGGDVVTYYLHHNVSSIPDEVCNEKIKNFLSHKQCCLAEYSKKVVKLGEIGSPDYKCCMIELIMANAFMEMLTMMNVDMIPSSAHTIVELGYQPVETISLTLNFGGVDIIHNATVLSGATKLEAYLTTINLINSTGVLTAELILLDSGHADYIVYAPDNTYDGQEITITIVKLTPVLGSTKITTLRFSGGVAKDSGCITLEEQCKLIDFIKQLCEKC